MSSIDQPLAYGAQSVVGHVREHNEDDWLADDELGLWIVADGMGGHEAGEVASRLACGTIRDTVANGRTLTEAIEQAQAELATAIDRGDGSEGMGTTVVALKIDGSRYQLAWVGDSRAYLWHDGQLRQLTHDHSYVQELIDNHAISTEEAEEHPERSTLSRCLGGGLEDELVVDEISGRLFAGERIILCSDGISGEVSTEDMAACLRQHSEETPDQVAQALIEAALSAGGNDNATAIVIAAPEDAPDRIRQTAPRKRLDIPAAEPEQGSRRPLARWVFPLLLIAVLALAALFFWIRDDAPPQSPPGPTQGSLHLEQVQTVAARIDSHIHANAPMQRG